MPRLTLRLLGSPRIELDGKPIEVDTRKAIALLAYLALTKGPHTREKVASLFWPETHNDKALGALRRTLSVLNKALAGVGLVIEREAVGFESGPETWVDVAEFGRLARGNDGLTPAAALYRDDFMAGFTLKDSPAFDDWQFFQSEALRREFAGVLEKLVAARAERADEYARRWLQLDPLHEPAHRALMQFYAESGQHAAALRQYRECVRVLQAELGVAPLAETTQLFEAIKESRGAGERVSRGEAQFSPAHSPTRSPTPLPLVGRAHELAQLVAACAPHHFIVLEGEAGIGKTRLMEEALELKRANGATALMLRCYAGQASLAYGPVIEGLRSALRSPGVAARVSALPAHHRAEAARLLPELHTADLPLIAPLESPGAQSRFLEALRLVLVAAIAEPAFGVLGVDDAQWADEATLDLLSYIVRRLPTSHRDGGEPRGVATTVALSQAQASLAPATPLAVLATWRGEDVPAGHRLRALLAEATRAGNAHHFTLTRLQLADVQTLMQSAIHHQPDPQLAHRLFAETEGLPLFVVEYLGSLAQTADTNWSTPTGVRELLSAKLAALSETGQQVLNAAAVIGRSFEFETLQAASGRGEGETLAALEELLARGLVREVNNGYDFSHEKLRSLAYEQTSLARRRILHRRTAEALVNVSHQRSAAGEIARHFQNAGQAEQAAHYFQLAGEHARSLFANAEALEHFRAALSAGHPTPTFLHEAIGDLQTLAGEYGAALQSYASAAATATPEMLAELERKLGNVYDRRGEWELAESHFRAAHAALGDDGPPAVLARLFTDWARAAHHTGQSGPAAERARHALQLAEGAHDAHALAQAHNVLGLVANREERFAEAQAHFEKSLELAEARIDPDARVAALNNLALVCREAGDLPRAQQLTEAALTLCASLGDRHREAALHNNLADLHHARGEEAAAMQHLTTAVKLFAEIGGGSNTQPEIWKLVEW
ncbi:MAG: tetratricopeptide repeat protein [Anaerolineales bacterium]